MTQQEAEHFQIVSSLALQNGNVKFIMEDKELMNKYDVYFAYLLELEECGLMSAQTLSLTLEASSEQADIIYNSRIVGMIKGKEETLKKMKISIYVFTESGRQLITAIHPKENFYYIRDCLESIFKNNQEFVITAHSINFIDDKGKINYNTEDILTSR